VSVSPMSQLTWPAAVKGLSAVPMNEKAVSPFPALPSASIRLSTIRSPIAALKSEPTVSELASTVDPARSLRSAPSPAAAGLVHCKMRHKMLFCSMRYPYGEKWIFFGSSSVPNPSGCYATGAILCPKFRA
jgi:hypothetical protein